MSNTNGALDKDWIDNQINKFIAIQERYEKYAEILQALLQKIAKKYDPLAIVQTRPKSTASFAEKIVRKWPRYHDPVNQLTDLCGGRVITHTQSQVKDISKFIEENFIIDWDNSIDVQQRLKPTEFGYRSVHYIIQIKPDIFLTEDIEEETLNDVLGLNAEIQIRTILEHAWADLYHQWGFKNEFEIPKKLQREMAGLSARLEAADNSFSGVLEELKNYYTSYGSYMNSEQIIKEIEKIEITLQYDPENLVLVRQLGKLVVALEDWTKAITVLSKFEKCSDPNIIRDLGISLCKKYKKDPKSAEFIKGQELLLKVGSPPYNDSDALASLGGTWKGIDNEKANEYYKKAYELDPTDAYPLGNYLESEIVKEKNLSTTALIKPIINKAIQRCKACIDVRVNIPWAYYDIGKLKLFLGDPYNSFSAYAKAIDLSTAEFMIETSLNSLKRMEVIKDLLKGYHWIVNLLWLGLAVKYENDTAKKEINKKALSKTINGKSPIIILVGGSASSDKQKMDSYGQLLFKAFDGYSGTIVSGGTTTGISRIAGDLKARYSDSIYTVGYVPKKISIKVDENQKRYNEICKTNGEHFSPLEATQYWLDIISSSIRAEQVKLLVIDGGKISVAECKLALTFGAKVGIIEGSGGETSKLFSDTDWNMSNNLIQLPKDAAIIKSFINSGNSEMDENLREIIAKDIHEQYRETKMKKPEISEPSLAKWKNLQENLKESNLNQADQIYEKLNRVGCGVRKIIEREIALMKFSESEIELMAELEHARWVVERLSDGWKPASEKNVAKKLSPYLVSWEFLSEEIKDYDRNTVKKIPEYLAKVGIEVYRLT